MANDDCLFESTSLLVEEEMAVASAPSANDCAMLAEKDEKEELTQNDNGDDDIVRKEVKGGAHGKTQQHEQQLQQQVSEKPLEEDDKENSYDTASLPPTSAKLKVEVQMDGSYTLENSFNVITSSGNDDSVIPAEPISPEKKQQVNESTQESGENTESENDTDNGHDVSQSFDTGSETSASTSVGSSSESSHSDCETSGDYHSGEEGEITFGSSHVDESSSFTHTTSSGEPSMSVDSTMGDSASRNHSQKTTFANDKSAEDSKIEASATSGETTIGNDTSASTNIDTSSSLAESIADPLLELSEEMEPVSEADKDVAAKDDMIELAKPDAGDGGYKIDSVEQHGDDEKQVEIVCSETDVRTNISENEALTFQTQKEESCSSKGDDDSLKPNQTIFPTNEGPALQIELKSAENLSKSAQETNEAVRAGSTIESKNLSTSRSSESLSTEEAADGVDMLGSNEASYDGNTHDGSDGVDHDPVALASIPTEGTDTQPISSQVTALINERPSKAESAQPDTLIDGAVVATVKTTKDCEMASPVEKFGAQNFCSSEEAEKDLLDESLMSSTKESSKGIPKVNDEENRDPSRLDPSHKKSLLVNTIDDAFGSDGRAMQAVAESIYENCEETRNKVASGPSDTVQSLDIQSIQDGLDSNSAPWTTDPAASTFISEATSSSLCYSFKQEDLDGDREFLDQTLNISVIEPSLQQSEMVTTMDLPSLVISEIVEESHENSCAQVCDGKEQNSKDAQSTESKVPLKVEGNKESSLPSENSSASDEMTDPQPKSKITDTRRECDTVNESAFSLPSLISTEEGHEGIELIRTLSTAATGVLEEDYLSEEEAVSPMIEASKNSLSEFVDNEDTSVDPLISRLSAGHGWRSKSTSSRRNSLDESNTPIARMRIARDDDYPSRSVADPDGKFIEKHSDPSLLGGLKKSASKRASNRPKPRVSFAAMHKGPHFSDSYTLHESSQSNEDTIAAMEDQRKTSGSSVDDVTRSRFAAYLRRRMIDYDDEDDEYDEGESFVQQTREDMQSIRCQAGIPKVLEPDSYTVESSFTTIQSKPDAPDDGSTVGDKVDTRDTKLEYAEASNYGDEDSESGSSYGTDSEYSDEEDTIKLPNIFASFFAEIEDTRDLGNTSLEHSPKWCERLGLPTVDQLEDLIKSATDFGGRRVAEKPYNVDQDALSEFVDELENDEPFRDDETSMTPHEEELSFALLPKSNDECNRQRAGDADTARSTRSVPSARSHESHQECGVLTFQDFHEIALMAADAIKETTQKSKPSQPLTMDFGRINPLNQTRPAIAENQISGDTVKDGGDNVLSYAAQNTGLEAEEDSFDPTRESDELRTDQQMEELSVKSQTSKVSGIDPPETSSYRQETQETEVESIGQISQERSKAHDRIAAKLEHIKKTQPHVYRVFLAKMAAAERAGRRFDFRRDDVVLSASTAPGTEEPKPEEPLRLATSDIPGNTGSPAIDTNANMMSVKTSNVSVKIEVESRPETLEKPPEASTQWENFEGSPFKDPHLQRASSVDSNEIFNELGDFKWLNSAKDSLTTTMETFMGGSETIAKPLKAKLMYYSKTHPGFYRLVLDKLAERERDTGQSSPPNAPSIKEGDAFAATGSVAAHGSSLKLNNASLNASRGGKTTENDQSILAGVEIEETDVLKSGSGAGDSPLHSVAATAEAAQSTKRPDIPEVTTITVKCPIKKVASTASLLKDLQATTSNESEATLKRNPSPVKSLSVSDNDAARGKCKDDNRNKSLKASNSKGLGFVSKVLNSSPTKNRSSSSLESDLEATENAKAGFAKKLELFAGNKSRRMAQQTQIQKAAMKSKINSRGSLVASKISMFNHIDHKTKIAGAGSSKRTSTSISSSNGESKSKEDPDRELDEKVDALRRFQAADTSRSKFSSSNVNSISKKTTTVTKQLQLAGTGTKARTKLSKQALKPSSGVAATASAQLPHSESNADSGDAKVSPTTQWETFDGSGFKDFVMQPFSGVAPEKENKQETLTKQVTKTQNSSQGAPQIDLETTFLDSILPPPPSFSASSEAHNQQRDPWDFSQAAEDQWEHFSPLSFDSKFTKWGINERSSIPRRKPRGRQKPRSSPSSIAEF